MAIVDEEERAALQVQGLGQCIRPRDDALHLLLVGLRLQLLDIEAQARQTLQNLDQAVRASGGTLANIVQCHVFLTERADFKAMNRVYAEFFKPPYPVRATVVVKELIAEGLRIEITATAVI